MAFRNLYVDLNARLRDDPSSSCDAFLILFRPAGPEAERHKTVEAFWASALFSFLEDHLEDNRFEELGEAGEYRALCDDEADRMLRQLLGTAGSEYIAVPADPTSCYLVHNESRFKALVGSDSRGFFAVIWNSRGEQTAR